MNVRIISLVNTVTRGNFILHIISETRCQIKLQIHHILYNIRDNISCIKLQRDNGLKVWCEFGNKISDNDFNKQIKVQNISKLFECLSSKG